MKKSSKASSETRKKMAAAQRGRRHSAETKKKMSETAKGRVFSKETREKMSEAHKGKYLGANSPNYGKHHSDEAKKRISEANKGKHRSDEIKKRMSEANKGKGNPFYGKKHTAETIKKLSKIAKKRHISEETREKLSKARKGKKNHNYGKHFSKEIRERMGAGRKGKYLGEKNHNWIGGGKIVGFEAASLQLSWCDSVRRNPRNKKQFQVKCALCGKWFCPTKDQVRSRISAVNHNNRGDCNFYCSEGCKRACPVFRRLQYKKDESPQPPIRTGQKEWRKHVIVCAEYACERCGKILDEKDLSAHHIKTVSQYPLESMDVDNGMALCRDCHKTVHSGVGCRPVDLRCQP